MRATFGFALSLLFALSLSAANPTITHVTPAGSPPEGGIEVTITGTGFLDECAPPAPCRSSVLFGSTPAAEVRFVNSTTLVVVTPPHLPGRTSVRLFQSNGFAVATDVFVFAGPVPDTFTRILVPTLTGPVRGANGSEFHTELALSTEGTARPVRVFGLEPYCPVLCPAWNFRENWLEVGDVGLVAPGDVYAAGKPGLFLYVENAESLAANLRVFDVTRDAQNFGTEIPLARDRDFRKDMLKLLRVPTDPRFRNTLRIYNGSDFGTTVYVKVGSVEVPLELPAARGLFEPGYATFTNFPANGTLENVEIRQAEPPISGGDMRASIWAFITVTNNDTQLITTISPQP